MPTWKRLLLLLSCLAGSIPCLPALADESNTAVLLTQEWPPYTGIKLPGNGTVSKRVRAAYAALGQEVRIGFFSWRRAMHLPYSDHRFTGFFPAYPSQTLKNICHFSEPVGVSQLGLAQLKSKPLQWKDVEDLNHYHIGVVSDYANEDTFDNLVQAGRIETLASESDAENLLNLAHGKVNGAIIDTQVFDWLMRNDARLQPYRGKLQMHERLLVTWPLFVCFRRDDEGIALRNHFNAGMARLNEAGKLSESGVKASRPVRQTRKKP